MESIEYLLVALIPFLALGLGFFIAHLARDELPGILPFLLKAQPFVFLASLFIVSLALTQWQFVMVLVLVALFLLIFWKQRTGHVLELSVLGILFVFTSLDMVAFYYFSMFVFIFSLISGMLYYISQYNPRLFKKNSGIFSYKHTMKTRPTIGHQVQHMYQSHLFFAVFVVLTYVLGIIIL